VSVTFVSCVKTNKDIFEFFSPSGSHIILVFRTKRGDDRVYRYRYSDIDIPTRTPLTGASNAGGVGKKRDSGRMSGFAAYTGLQCCQPYESRAVKNKDATNGGERRALTAASVVRTRRRRNVCDGLDVIRRNRRSTPPPRTQPLWSQPPFSAV